MKKSVVWLLAASLGLTACAGETTTSVKPMQRRDKQLSCREVLLEMNEAEFTKKEAVNKRNPSLKTVLMPLGYVSTYMNAEDSIDSADARIAYLDKIYEIMRCDDNKGQEYSAVAPVQPQYAVPVMPAQAPAAAAYSYDPAYDGYTPIRERFEQRSKERGLY